VVPQDAARPQLFVDVGKYTALTLLFCLTVALIPALSFITLAFCPLPILILAARHSPKVALASVVLVTAILAPLVGIFEAATLVLITISLSIGYFLAVERNLSFSVIMASSTAIIAISLIIFGFITFQATKVNIVDSQIKAARKDLTTLKKEYKKEYEKQGISGDQIEEQFQAIDDSIKLLAQVVPAGVIIFSIWVSFLDLIVSGYVLKRMQKSFIAPPAFKNWQMPWFFAWGYIVGLAGTFFSGYLGAYQKIGLAIGMNFLVVFNLLFLVQGISIIYFYMDKLKLHNAIRALGIGMIIAIPLISPMVAWFGLLDVWFNFRKIPIEA